MKAPPLPLVLVEWDDANNFEEWTEPGDEHGTMLAPIVTVGFVIKETKKVLFIAASLDLKLYERTGKVNSVCGTMSIPKAIIKSRRRLK